MTIHEDHPFVPPDDDRDAVRRLRGRMAAPVTVWAAGAGTDRVGFTVSSLVIADGQPARVLGLVDEDSEFAEAMPDIFSVNILGEPHRYLADAFAGQVPAPGGAFRLADWRDTSWGPVLDGNAGWFGVERDSPAPEHLGWGLAVTGAIAHIELADTDSLIHMRGRYRI